jgi:hypothetical protein
VKPNLRKVTKHRFPLLLNLREKESLGSATGGQSFSRIFLHMEWTSSENGTLLVIDNRAFDFFGAVDNQWNRLTRSCHTVNRLTATQEKYQSALSLIKNYSPPNSMSAKIASAWSLDTWTLVEVEFADLLPAVVLIHTQNDQPSIVPNAVWSGYTKPWKSAPYIRKYIFKNADGLPQALPDCFEPQSLSFQ